MGGITKLNKYSSLLGDFYDRTPKAVFVAILVSEYLNRLNIKSDDLKEAIIKEWETLYENCIVPQKPPKL